VGFVVTGFEAASNAKCNLNSQRKVLESARVNWIDLIFLFTLLSRLNLNGNTPNNVPKQRQRRFGLLMYYLWLYRKWNQQTQRHLLLLFT